MAIAQDRAAVRPLQPTKEIEMSMLGSIGTKARRSPTWTLVASFGAVAIVAAAVFGTYWLLRDDSQASAQTGNQVEFQVQRGDIITSVSLGGTSAFPDKEELSFGGGGTVAEVMVSNGDTVEEGEVIAQLDDATIASLRVALSTAESDLNDAQEIYDKAVSGSTSRAEIAEAEEQLALAELSVSAARKSLDEVSAADGIDPTSVSEARDTVDFAERELAAAEEALENALDPADVAERADELEYAIDEYREVLMRWLGAVPDGFELMTLNDILDLWSTDLTEIYTTHADEQADSDTPWLDNEETPWNDVLVWTWTRMSASVVDTESTSSNNRGGILTPLAEIESSWTALEEARSALDAEETESESALLAAEQAVARERSDLSAAQDAFDELLDPVLLQARQAALDAAIANRDAAEIVLTQARSNEQMTMESAQSRLDLASQQFDDAAEALESATLLSPVNGTVLAINIEAGDSVTPTTIVAEIADTSVIAVESSVDEEDILSIQVGLPVSVSLDAVSGQSFTGTVTSVGQAEQSQQGAVTFPVTITLDDTRDLALVEGLTASAQVINSQVSDVLMVPVAAVGGSIFEPSVEVVTDSGTRETPVQLGSSNGSFVEVVSGLAEGETVLATIAGALGLQDPSDQPFLPRGSFTGGAVVIPGADGSTSITIPGGRFGGGGGGGR